MKIKFIFLFVLLIYLTQYSDGTLREDDADRALFKDDVTLGSTCFRFVIILYDFFCSLLTIVFFWIILPAVLIVLAFVFVLSFSISTNRSKNSYQLKFLLQKDRYFSLLMFSIPGNQIIFFPLILLSIVNRYHPIETFLFACFNLQIAIVFTDVQGSTALWETDAYVQELIRHDLIFLFRSLLHNLDHFFPFFPSSYVMDGYLSYLCRKMMTKAIGIHHRVIRELIRAHGGYEVKTEGDAFMVFDFLNSFLEL